MSLIDKKSYESLIEWAKENEDRYIFPMISDEEDSYYIDRNSEETYMMEYSFETMGGLKEALEEYSGLSEFPEILRIITSEACKNRFDKGRAVYQAGSERQVLEKAQDDKTALPEFIYVF